MMPAGFSKIALLIDAGSAINSAVATTLSKRRFRINFEIL